MGGVGDLKRFSGILNRLRVLSLKCTILKTIMSICVSVALLHGI